MANTLKIKRSSVQGKVPTVGDLQLGELGINTFDGKLYTKKDNGAESIVEIGAGGGGGSYTISSTAPTSPSSGDKWYDLDDGREYTLINDGNTAQWVETGVNSVGTGTPDGDKGEITISSSGTIWTIDNGAITNAKVSATAAIDGTKINPNFGAQNIQSSQPNQALLLSGSLNAATTNQGLLSLGTLGFSGARMGASMASSQTSYYQVVLQNTSNNSGASCDFVVCNDVSTDSTYYGNFGINSSTYNGTGALSAPNATYVTSTTGPVVLGSTTAHDLRFVYNSETTDSLTISANDATFGKTLKPRAGTATANTAPLIFTSGTNLSVPVAGAVEYDGTHVYATPTTVSGRGQIPVLRTFRLAADGSALGPTIADYFGATSSINLAATSVYDLEYMTYFSKATAGTVTWTLTASSAPVLISGVYHGSPVTGIAAGTPITGYAGSRGATTAAFGATGSITAGVFMALQFKVQVITNLATTFKLQVTSSAGTVTPLAGSFYTVKQIAGSTGSFA